MSIRRSLFWVYGAQLVTFVATFATSIAVARLLPPREFGVYVLASAVTAILTILTSFSVQAYIVREAEIDRRILRDAFTAQAILGALLALLIGVAAAIETKVGQVGVGRVLLLLALNPLLGIFELVPSALYTREMRFGILSGLTVIRTLVGSIVTVWFAANGAGAASLAYGVLANTACGMFYMLARRRNDVFHRPAFRRLRPIMVFGVQMMSISGVAQLAQRASDILLVHFLGLSALGLYARASGLANTVFANVYGQATGIVFSQMSKDDREGRSIRPTFEHAMSIITSLVWPLVIGIAVLARPIVVLLYGERWLPAALPLSLLMIAQFVVLGFGMNWEIFVLRKQTGLQTRFEFIRAVLGVGAFAIGATISIGAAAVGRVVEALVGYALYRPHMDRMIGTTKGTIERLYLDSFVLTLVAVGPALILMVWTDWNPHASWLFITLATIAGIILWLTTLRLQRHPLIGELSMIGGKLAGYVGRGRQQDEVA